MTFHPIFSNHRKKYTLDCGTITYLNVRVIQFLGRLMESTLSLAIKIYVGLNPNHLYICFFKIIFLFFHLFFHLFVCFFLDFVDKLIF